MERQSGQNRYYRSMGDVSGRWAMSVIDGRSIGDVSGRWAMSDPPPTSRIGVP